MINSQIEKNAIVTISEEGWLMVWNGSEKQNYQSKNSIEDFDFRGRTYHDGVDYFNLTEMEIELLLKSFELEQI